MTNKHNQNWPCLWVFNVIILNSILNSNIEMLNNDISKKFNAKYVDFTGLTFNGTYEVFSTSTLGVDANKIIGVHAFPLLDGRYGISNTTVLSPDQFAVNFLENINITNASMRAIVWYVD